MIGSTLLACTSVQAAVTTMTVSDDGASLVVTVPAGCQTGCKLELAYTNALKSACFFAKDDRAVNRSDWVAAQTLVESVPAEGATYTVPLATLGVSADACFRLFASGPFAILDYAWINANNAYIDTGIKDSDVNGLELAFLPTSSAGQYDFMFGSTSGSASGVSLQHGGSYAKAYFSRWTSNKYTYGNVFSFNTSAKNTIVFRNQSLTFNGSGWSATAGAKSWTTSPVGTSGKTLCLGCLSGSENALSHDKWYAVKFWGTRQQMLADYVPVQWGSTVGFFDRATGNLVTSTGGGALTAGTVTTAAGTATLAVGDLRTFPRLAPKSASVTLDKTDGAKLTITVHPGYGAGSTLYLASGTTDGGSDLNAWSDRLVVAESIPAAGGTYEVDLVANGLATDKVFRVFAGGIYTPLNRVHLNSNDDWVDTQVRDYQAYRLEFGYTPTGFANLYGGIIGTDDGNNKPGFRICHGGSLAKLCITQRSWSKYTYIYYDYSTTANNIFRASGDGMSINGNFFNPQSGNDMWTTSPLGTTGLTLCLGRLAVEATSGKGGYGWIYSLWIRNLEDTLLIDLHPMQKQDGTVGFFDSVSGTFVTPTGGGAFVAGTATGDAAYTGTSFSDTLTVDATLPITAGWIGGTQTDLGTAANWSCTNYLGAALTDTLPRAGVTRVAFTGALAFSCTNAVDRRWDTAVFNACTLADTCDWRAIGTFTGTVDLQGHDLSLATPPAGATLTDTTTGTASNLRFVIPAGTTVENTSATITGNIRFVKEGAGTFTATLYPQTYTGGNDIVEGTLRVGVSGTINRVEKQSYFGSTLTLDVEPNGTLDANGTCYWGYHTINLHGGTLLFSSVPSTYFFNPNLNLTADSFVEAAANSDLRANMDLAGYTLTCHIQDGLWFWFNSGSSTAGKIVATGSGIFNTDYSSTRDWSNLSFDIGSKYNQACSSITVADLTVRCPAGGLSAVSGNLLKVNGRFTPVTQNFPNVQLQNGATLDISASTTLPWSATSTVEGCALSFADNATVKVMPLGDSITDGTSLYSFYARPNYRLELMARLEAAGFKAQALGYHASCNLNAAGLVAPAAHQLHASLSGQMCRTAVNAGWEDSVDVTLDIAGEPDFVTFKIGTNDLGSGGQSPASCFEAWSNVVWKILRARPNARVVVTPIVNHVNSATIASYNELIRAGATAFPSNRVVLVDVCNLLSDNADFADNTHPSWIGHDKVSACFFDAITNALAQGSVPRSDTNARAQGSVPTTYTTTRGVVANVPRAYWDGYRRVARLPIQSTTKLADLAYTRFDAALATQKYARVAYYLELKRRNTERIDYHGHRRFVWADMDAFGTCDWSAAQFPTNAIQQRVVTNLHVASNDTGIRTIPADRAGETGFIEFWPYTYGEAASGVAGAPADLFAMDWNDTCSGSGGYGSFQIHRVFADGASWNAGEVLMAFNRWNASGNNEIGIGSFPQRVKSKSMDYTFTSGWTQVDASAYEEMFLEIWVKPVDAADEPTDVLTEWVNQPLTNVWFRADAVQTVNGTWQPQPAFTNGLAQVDEQTGLAFDIATKSAAGKYTLVESEVAFSEPVTEEALTALDLTGCQSALTPGVSDWQVWNGTEWTPLTGRTVRPGRWWVRIVHDSSSARPRVAYAVRHAEDTAFTLLRTANGSPWLACGAGVDAKRLSGIDYRCGGSFVAHAGACQIVPAGNGIVIYIAQALHAPTP